MVSSGEKDQVKLLGQWMSPFVHRIILGLKIKGVPFEYVEEDLGNKSTMLLDYNPIHKKVPVLVHAGKSVSESQVILQYIDETWPDHQNSLLPTNSLYDRAMARFWSKYIDEKVSEVLRGFLTSNEAEKHLDTLWQVLKPLDEQLMGKKFFGGESSIGFIDIVAVYLSYFSEAMSVALGIELISEDKFPNLYAWTKRIMEVQVVKENIPKQGDIVTYIETRRKCWIAAAAQRN